MSSLVIVESPAKAKTISRILGRNYTVEASYGHVRDLPENADEIPEKIKKEPWARLGVNVAAHFEPVYIIPADKKKHIKRLQDAMKGADELLLATDEDREGESISWHVVEVLKPKVPVRRIAFHEITDEAIHRALENPRDVDLNLVRAQESRRILDRLFGYQLSPLLWKKVRTGLSAGRVQSVAVRLCVLRERERQRFKSAGFWDVEAELEHGGRRFTAQLVRLGERRLATGQDFDPETGQLKRSADVLWIASRAEADKAIAGWGELWKVSSVEEKPFTRKPAPPFTTSSLQQEANRKLRFSARQTMRIAQKLYEGVDVGGERLGLITYMRTDSVTLSDRALKEAEQVIRERYGKDYTEGPRRYRTQAKGAQEAHEAIRPTELGRTADAVAKYLSSDELRLYELIWKRTVASQMADARLLRTAVEITAPGKGGPAGVFSATGKSIEFPGFLRAYVEGSDDPDADIADQEVILPQLARGESCPPRSVAAKGHETAPPARYTEASLVKKLESEGIGRPSTYATIIDTIQERGYVVKQSNALVPTFTAFAVTQLLEAHFGDYVDTRFTARMEQQLDDVAEGGLDWRSHLASFYFGDGEEQGLERRIAAEAPHIDYPAIELGKNPAGGAPVTVRVGRYGPYVQTETSDGQRLVASLPDDVAPADFSTDAALALLNQAREGAKTVGKDPATGQPVLLARGRFGAYVQLGEGDGKTGPKPKRASLPQGVSEDDVTLEQALRWLSLPRNLGKDPASGEEVITTTGRFGPFVKQGDEFRSLGPQDDVYTITLGRALELLAQPKQRGRQTSATRTVLKEFGADGGGKPVQLLDGRYGPYLTNGEINASLPKGTNADELDLEAAMNFLLERGKPAKKRGAPRTPRPGAKATTTARTTRTAKPTRGKTRR